MGTKVHCESYLPGFHSMRDLNEGSSSNNWPLLYCDNSLGNGQYHNGYLGRTSSDAYPGGDKDVLKQKMLEHEAVFKHQVFELHRLYKTQRDMMDEIKRKELHKHRIPMETSSSSIPLASQMHPEDAWKLQKSNFPSLSSVSGIEINSSPLSCSGGNVAQVDRYLSQNGFNPKDCEILESRPSKVRKQLFDLQHAAGEYTNPEERNKVSDNSIYFLNNNHRLSNLDMNVGRGLKVESNGDTSVPNSIGLADLNGPVQVEEPSNAAPFHFSNSQFLLGMSKEVLKNPQLQKSNGVFNGLHIESKGNGKERSFFMYEDGFGRTSLDGIPQGPEKDKSLVSLNPIDASLNKAHHPLGISRPDYLRSEVWRDKERAVHGLQLSETTRAYFNNYNSDPFSSLTHKMTSTSTQTQIHPPQTLLTASNKSSQSYSQSHEILEDRLRSIKGLYCGPSSGNMDPPARFPGPSLENLICNKYGSVSYSPGSYSKGSNCNDTKMGKEVNLNICPSKSSYGEIIDLERKWEEEGIKVLPWLKTEKMEKISEKKIFGVPIFDNSRCNPKKESSSLSSTSASLKGKGKNGFIDINVACDIECGTDIAEEMPLAEKSNASGRTLFDLNSCMTEDEITIAPSLTSTNANPKVIIDLEVLPIPESDEDIPPVEQSRDEALVIAAQAIITISSLNSYNCVEEVTDHSEEVPSPDPLFWFVDVVSSLVGEFDDFALESEGKRYAKEGPFRHELDEFEALTLNLKEMTMEEYMPKPLVLDIRETDENGNNIETGNARNRTRRGQGKRGRHRRNNFQRDILPGLASLSRHEVTEDIQTFGGLMRATGHVWSSGLTRRKGGGRGRKRAPPPPLDVGPATIVVCPSSIAQEIHNIGVGIEDRSVTMWGKTPRRPRRQRCPPPLVPLA